YKLAPYGEVIRSFYINGDGTATLEGDPEIGFPATQPNMLTIYMDDEKVCHLRGAWSKNYFEMKNSGLPFRLPRALCYALPLRTSTITVQFSFWGPPKLRPVMMWKATGPLWFSQGTTRLRYLRDWTIS